MHTLVRRIEARDASANRVMDSAWDQRIQQMSDRELADFIVAELSDMEAQGIRLPAGWRSRPICFTHFDGLLASAKAQLAVLQRKRQINTHRWRGFSLAPWLTLAPLQEVRSMNVE